MRTRAFLPARWFRAGALTILAATALAGCERRPAEDVRVITVWAHQGQARENAAMRSIVDAFNERHAAERIRIDITFFPDRGYADKVSIASFSGPLPDMLDIDGPYVGPWAAEGTLQPLDDLVGDALRADVLPSLLEQGTYDGKLYALGAFDSALVVYYNRDMLAQAGVSPPERAADAWTWPQFVAALRQVKPHAKIPLSLHMDDQSNEWFTYAFSPLVWSAGGNLIDTVNGRATGALDGPATVAALTQWQQLFQEGLAEATSTNPDPFSTKLATFDWTGHWMLPTFEQTADLNFGVMPLPKMGARPVCASGSWCWGISKDCQDPALAWKALAWFLDPEAGIKPIVAANGAVPGRRSAFALFPAYEQMPRRLFREQLELAARTRPRTAAYLALTSEFARALRDIAGGADVQTSLTKAAQTVQRALDRHTAPGG